MTTIDVHCDGGAEEGWQCSVSVRDDGGALSKHTVTVSSAGLARLAPRSGEPAALVRASFEFLLEREPPTSILRTFEIGVIARYFPEYEAEIRRRLGAAD